MSMIKIWVHLVWSTKYRKPLLVKEVREQLFEHIKTRMSSKGIYIDCINGHLDHVHCLITLGSNDNIAKVANLIKGESSRWMNKNRLCDEHFKWQRQYYAVSVGLRQIKRVRLYIKNQETHHSSCDLKVFHSCDLKVAARMEKNKK